MAAPEEAIPEFPSCARCSNPGLRLKWGCDRPSESPWDRINPCPFCGGDNDDCPECKGSGRVPLYDCPNRVIRPEHRAMVEAVSMIRNHGILPDAGGWSDQAAMVSQCFGIVSSELAQWERYRIKNPKE